MLRQILDRIAQGGTWSAEELARELGTTSQLVAAMLEELARQGYLKPADSPCSGACASCPAAKGCVRGAGQRVWALNIDRRP